jgi:hypothetical protein
MVLCISHFYLFWCVKLCELENFVTGVLLGCLETCLEYLRLLVCYSLHPKNIIILGFRITSLTKFIENTCKFYILKQILLKNRFKYISNDINFVL